MFRAYVYIFDNIEQTILGSVIKSNLSLQANLTRLTVGIDLENGLISFFFGLSLKYCKIHFYMLQYIDLEVNTVLNLNVDFYLESDFYRKF